MAEHLEKAATSPSRYATTSTASNSHEDTAINSLPYTKDNKGKGPLLETSPGKPDIPLDPYGKPSLIKCYRCQGTGHKSNVCPLRFTMRKHS